jgi:manganese transport protein
VGTSIAFCSGQSSTFTGAIAGQVILGEHSVGKLLVLTQVVLSAQLTFATFPLLRFTDDRTLMGVFANGPITKAVAWSLFVVISSANAWLVVQTFAA